MLLLAQSALTACVFHCFVKVFLGKRGFGEGTFFPHFLEGRDAGVPHPGMKELNGDLGIARGIGGNTLIHRGNGVCSGVSEREGIEGRIKRIAKLINILSIALYRSNEAVGCRIHEPKVGVLVDHLELLGEPAEGNHTCR